MRIKIEKHDGTHVVVYWPSLGLIRAWLLMVCFDLLTGTVFFPAVAGPPFWVCWAAVTVFRIIVAIVRETA